MRTVLALFALAFCVIVTALPPPDPGYPKPPPGLGDPAWEDLGLPGGGGPGGSPGGMVEIHRGVWDNSATACPKRKGLSCERVLDDADYQSWAMDVSLRNMITCNKEYARIYWKCFGKKGMTCPSGYGNDKSTGTYWRNFKEGWHRICGERFHDRFIEGQMQGIFSKNW